MAIVHLTESTFYSGHLNKDNIPTLIGTFKTNHMHENRQNVFAKYENKIMLWLSIESYQKERVYSTHDSFHYH